MDNHELRPSVTHVNSSMTDTSNGAQVLWPVWKFRERREGRGVEGRRVVERIVEGNDSPLPCLDVFKISKEEGRN